METQKEPTLLKRVLNFYANQRNWTPQSKTEGFGAVEHDEGDLARDILEFFERYGKDLHIRSTISVLESVEHVPLAWWPSKDTTTGQTVSQSAGGQRRCPLCYESLPNHGLDCNLEAHIIGYKLLVSILDRLSANEAANERK
jgi:hypothetical protein